MLQRVMGKDDQHRVAETMMKAMEMHHFRAVGNAFRAHSEIPIFSHSIEVMKRISHYGINFENCRMTEREIVLGLQLGLTHDIYEDTNVDEQEFIDTFGKELSDLVKQVTRKHGHESKIQKWEFLKGFVSGWHHYLAVICKIADRYVNTMDYYRRNPRYASFYALQGFPLYYSWWQFGKTMEPELDYYVNVDIEQLMVMAKNRYDIVYPYDLDQIEKIVTK